MRRSAFIRGRTLQTRFRWRCAISAPSSAPIDLLQQRDLWQPPPSSVAPIPDLPALTPERGSSTVSGNSARRYKIQTPVTPGLFRVPVRKRARQAVTAFGDDEAGLEFTDLVWLRPPEGLGALAPRGEEVEDADA